MTIAGRAALVVALLATARAAGAVDCPQDAFALWAGGWLRGANVFQGRNPGGASTGFGDGDFAQSDFDALAQTGANYVHVSHAGVFAEAPPYGLDADAEANLDRVVDMAARAGLLVGIAFRSGPGRNENAISNRDGALDETIWTSQAAHDAWAAMLRHVAERYAGNPAVVGLSPMVEANAYARRGFPDPDAFYAQFAGSLEDVNGLYAQVTAAVREVNAGVPLLLEPEGYGNVGWLPYLTVTGDPRTVYTPHDYTPFEYTHETVPGATYPGDYDVDGDGQADHVDRDFLAAYLQTAQGFATQHGVPVALTEFGAHVTAPNVAAYLADRIAIQDAIGAWAVWTWQPADFIDPFDVHGASGAHDALVAAWATNCRPAPGGGGGGGGGGGEATIEGRVRTLRRNGTAGKPLAGVTMSAAGVTTKTRRRRTKGAYMLRVPAGTIQLSASARRRRCHVGAVDGAEGLVVSLAAGEIRSIDAFCGRR